MRNVRNVFKLCAVLLALFALSLSGCRAKGRVMGGGGSEDEVPMSRSVLLRELRAFQENEYTVVASVQTIQPVGSAEDGGIETEVVPINFDGGVTFDSNRYHYSINLNSPTPVQLVLRALPVSESATVQIRHLQLAGSNIDSEPGTSYSGEISPGDLVRVSVSEEGAASAAVYVISFYS